MATEVTDAEIEIPAEEVIPDTVVIEPAAKKPEILKPEEGLEKLKKQLEDEQRDKQAATARASAAEADAAAARASEVQARTEVQDSRLSEITSAIARMKQTKELLKSSYMEAAAAGDHAKMADIQDQMTDATVDLKQLERGKQQIEAAPKPQPRPSITVADPVEKLAGQLSARSAAWVRAHPDHATGSKYQKMIAAHQLAIADGVAADSDEYFEAIEHTLKLREPTVVATEVDTTQQRATGGRSTAPAAAPVSRGGNGGGSKPRSMTLTREMREMASAMGMTDQEYAKYRQQLIDEGQIH